MRVIAYTANVTGLRPRVQQHGWLAALLGVCEDADCLRLQEIKVVRQDVAQDVSVTPGFETVFAFHRAVRPGRMGNSGVATVCRLPRPPPQKLLQARWLNRTSLGPAGAHLSARGWGEPWLQVKRRRMGGGVPGSGCRRAPHGGMRTGVVAAARGRVLESWSVEEWGDGHSSGGDERGKAIPGLDEEEEGEEELGSEAGGGLYAVTEHPAAGGEGVEQPGRVGELWRGVVEWLLRAAVPMLTAVEVLGAVAVLAVQLFWAVSAWTARQAATSAGEHVRSPASAALGAALITGNKLPPWFVTAEALCRWQSALLAAVLLAVLVSRLVLLTRPAPTSGAEQQQQHLATGWGAPGVGGRAAAGAYVGSSGGDLEEQVRHMEGDLGVTVGMLRALSRHVEKLGVQFRVTRRTLRDPINQTVEQVEATSRQVEMLQGAVVAVQQDLRELQLILVCLQDQSIRQFDLFATALRSMQQELRSHKANSPQSGSSAGAAGKEEQPSTATPRGSHAQGTHDGAGSVFASARQAIGEPAKRAGGTAGRSSGRGNKEVEGDNGRSVERVNAASAGTPAASHVWRTPAVRASNPVLGTEGQTGVQEVLLPVALSPREDFWAST